MLLPQSFIEKYTHLLGDEAEAFFASFDKDPVSAFRTNPLKASQAQFDHPIPNTLWGYYGKVAGKSPEHVTGLVYSQEPAAQMVVQVADIKPNMRVLDLAAAPGGKSTHALAYLNNTGLLVSNEISSKRSKILVENIERFGARNVLVTNESAERLAKTFHAFFDVIIFDGPCSGEGMFRKDHDAIQYWNKDYPDTCSRLQKAILADAMSMLAPGGSLVYSTCTWSYEENEAVVSWLLETYPYLRLELIPKCNGMVEGLAMPEVARLYPHRHQGEGQFVAKLLDTRPPVVSQVKSGKSNLSHEQKDLWQAFTTIHIKSALTGLLQVFGDQLYLLPDGLPDLKHLKIARNGLHLGTFKKKRFEPSFALGLALRPDEVSQTVALSEDDFTRYVAGHQVELPEALSNGWYQVTVGGNGLGFAKVVGTTLKNYFPKGLRFQS